MKRSDETMFNLNNLKMNVIQTAPNGVINKDTIFVFSQDGCQVWAEYSGGRVIRGYLVGILKGSQLQFRYCQMEEGDVLNGGVSNCKVLISKDGFIQIVEEFQWESKEGTGVNIIQEIR
jgi:hypothetical protein